MYGHISRAEQLQQRRMNKANGQYRNENDNNNLYNRHAYPSYNTPNKQKRVTIADRQPSVHYIPNKGDVDRGHGKYDDNTTSALKNRRRQKLLDLKERGRIKERRGPSGSHGYSEADASSGGFLCCGGYDESDDDNNQRVNRTTKQARNRTNNQVIRTHSARKIISVSPVRRSHRNPKVSPFPNKDDRNWKKRVYDEKDPFYERQRKIGFNEPDQPYPYTVKQPRDLPYERERNDLYPYEDDRIRNKLRRDNERNDKDEDYYNQIREYSPQKELRMPSSNLEYREPPHSNELDMIRFEEEESERIRRFQAKHGNYERKIHEAQREENKMIQLRDLLHRQNLDSD